MIHCLCYIVEKRRHRIMDTISGERGDELLRT